MLFLSVLWLLKLVSRGPVFKRVFIAILMKMVKRTGLFSEGCYLEDNPDVAESVMSPLRHYVAYGDKEGRAPIPLFDPVFYRTQTIGPLCNVNALLHYSYVGRYLGFSPSAWFDLKFYFTNNKDITRSGIDPLLHYLQWGGIEGRSPCSQFDGSSYLRDNPDVEAARINPLLHYICYGRYEGRQINPVGLEGENYEIASVAAISSPVMPALESWDGIKHRSDVNDAVVDVVIPVYKGHSETLNCIFSVLVSEVEIPYELIVIEDASPDANLVVDLQTLAKKGLFTLHSNSTNRGFVQTVNFGMGLNHTRDVVLLNSDTEVYDGWLDRLYQISQRNSRIASVTPLSNNATICSYPRFLDDNPYPLELSYKELDCLASTVNFEEIEVPTAVGFCMYIKRKCLNDIGLFDAETFGRGYGEENDFCQRAFNHGWKNVVAPNIFVRHWGATSFQGEKAKRVQAALKILDRLHPSYQKRVSEFIKKDPLLESRKRLDVARMKRMSKAKNVLIINHNRGGGSERHVQEDIQRLNLEGVGVFVMRPVSGHPSQALFSHPIIKSLPNFPPLDLRDTAGLEEILKDLRISEIHTHGLIDFISDAPDHLLSLIKSTEVRWEVNLHDYKVICPRVNLVDGTGFYCQERSENSCNRCLVEQGSEFEVFDIAKWRSLHLRALKSADEVFVPDQDMAERLERYFPEICFRVSPHEEINPETLRVQTPVLHSGERLRIVIIGAIGSIKGYDVLLACARDAKKRRLPIEFIVMGYSMNDRALRDAGVTVTGRYLEKNSVETLLSLSPHVVWLPSIWPETYSYTLSIALKCGFPVFAFDLGAIARRLRSLGQNAGLVPLELGNSPEGINSLFLEYGKTVRSHGETFEQE